MKQGVQTDAKCTSNNVELVCEQALRGALAAWWEKEGELTTTFLEHADSGKNRKSHGNEA